MAKKTVTNTKDCADCINCELRKSKNDKLDLIYCFDKNKQYIWGQYISPCENYKKKEEK